MRFLFRRAFFPQLFIAESCLLPDWHALFQFIHRPLTGGKGFSPILRRDPQKKRRFPRGHKPNPMMEDEELQPELFHRPLRKQMQLMPGHQPVRFIIEPRDLTPGFERSNHPSKFDNRTRRTVRETIRHPEFCLCQ